MYLLKQFNKMVFPDNTYCQRKTVLLHGVCFYFTCLACLTPLLVVLYSLTRLHYWDLENHATNEAITHLIRNHLLNGIIVVAIIAPLLEEIVFRLWLSFSRRDIAISAFVMVYLIMTLALRTSNTPIYTPMIIRGTEGVLQSEFVRNIGIKMLVASAICVLLLRWKIKSREREGMMYKVATLFSVFSFMLLHTLNYSFTVSLFPFVLIMCLPQLILGMTITYYRLQLGFFYGYAFHVLINLTSILLSLP